MDNLALFFNQYGAVFTSVAVLFAAIMGYGKLSQQTAANTKAIDELKGEVKDVRGDIKEIRTDLTNVRVEAAQHHARTDAKIDLMMQLIEKKAC